MGPNSSLRPESITGEAIYDALRAEQLRRAVVALDTAADALPTEDETPLIAQRLAGEGVRGAGGMEQWVGRGKVRSVTVLPPHQSFTIDDAPGVVTYNQFVRVEIERHKPFSRKPGPVVKHYILSEWCDSIENHPVTDNAADVSYNTTGANVVFDSDRAAIVPPQDTFRLGLATFDNTVKPYTLGGNPQHNQVMPMFVQASERYPDDDVKIGPVDVRPYLAEARALDAVTFGDWESECKMALDAVEKHANPESKKVRFAWAKRCLGKRGVQPAQAPPAAE